MQFSNPRKQATFTDWPLGGARRGECTFQVHADPKKGERVSRVTTGKPKYTTYADRWAIVDGDDGRTYLLCLSTKYGHAISIMQSDMQHNATTEQLGRYHYVPNDGADAELFAQLKAMIDSL